jgi:flagellar protein FlbD
MIQLTRLNHVPFLVNSDLIEHVETTPDTVVTLTNGQKFVVQESAETIVERILEFRRCIFRGVCRLWPEQDPERENAGPEA